MDRRSFFRWVAGGVLGALGIHSASASARPDHLFYGRSARVSREEFYRMLNDMEQNFWGPPGPSESKFGIDYWIKGKDVPKDGSAGYPRFAMFFHDKKETG